MKKREQGVLSVEASIVLTLMLLFILFLFSFGRVYRAQNLVSHATLQSADAVALESYLRETALQADASDVVYLANQITDSSAISAEGLESLRSANLPKIARQKFIAAIASSEAKADEKLRSMGVKDGLAGIDFSECKMDLGTDDVIIAITYTIEMQFPVLGYDEITVTKAAKAKTFGEILFEVSTKPNNPGWGSTSGDDKVVHGSEVWITATPNYGYKFVSWDDGNTDNPRKVTVTDAQKYTAIFEPDSFGINIRKKIEYDTSNSTFSHSDFGSFNGAGNYLYLTNATLTATPSTHYEFKGWDINGDGTVDKYDKTITITVDKTYDNVVAVFKPAEYTITVKANDTSYGSVEALQGSKKSTSIKAEYGSTVQLIASPKNGNYLFQSWSHTNTNPSTPVTVKGNETYVATFVPNTYTVTFKANGSTHATVQVVRGSTIDGSNAAFGSSMPRNPGKDGASFDKWIYNGTQFTGSSPVPGNITVTATWKYTVTLNANGGKIEGSSSKTYEVSEDGYFNFDAHTPTKDGYKFEGWGSGYSGNIKITSNISVTAAWSCKHKFDNGVSRLYEEKIGDGQCGECVVTTKCKGCDYSDTKKMSGKCDWGANCGVDHTYTWNGVCTGSSTKHVWGKMRCITCKHCGSCKNKKKASYYVQIGLCKESEMRNYSYIAGTSGKLCDKHNGKDMEKYKKVVNDKAHK